MPSCIPMAARPSKAESVTSGIPRVGTGVRSGKQLRTRGRNFHPIISSPQIHAGRGVHGGVTFRGVERHPTTSVEPPKSPDLHLSLDALGRTVHRIPRSSPWIRRPMSPVAQSPVSQSPKVPERPDGQGTAKRRRTRGPRPPSHHACVACKARKVRCDAVRPTCSYCTARNIDCVYPPTFKRASCSEAYVASPLSPTDRLLLLHFRSHVASLESRLSEFEAR